LQIWQKTTAATHAGIKAVSSLQSPDGQDELGAEDEKTLTEKHDQQFTIAITRSKYKHERRRIVCIQTGIYRLFPLIITSVSYVMRLCSKQWL
jgi:hypothetical protein